MGTVPSRADLNSQFFLVICIKMVLQYTPPNHGLDNIHAHASVPTPTKGLLMDSNLLNLRSSRGATNLVHTDRASKLVKKYLTALSMYSPRSFYWIA